MVHLGKVTNDKDAKASKSSIDDLGDLGLEDDAENEMSTNVYGSRFASTDLPKHEMPEGEMPREIAYRMIK